MMLIAVSAGKVKSKNSRLYSLEMAFRSWLKCFFSRGRGRRGKRLLSRESENDRCKSERGTLPRCAGNSRYRGDDWRGDRGNDYLRARGRRWTACQCLLG